MPIRGDHSAASCTEVLADAGAKVEFVFRGHMAAHKSGYFNYPIYLKHFYEKGVEMTPDRRLIKVEGADQNLCATFENELTGKVEQRLIDQVVVEHGTVPLDDLFKELKELTPLDETISQRLAELTYPNRNLRRL